jgi:hypothetical protein
MQMRNTAFTLALGAALLSGCAKEKPKADPQAAAPTAESESDDPLMREMLDVVKNCKVNPEHSVISQCADKEKSDLIRDFRRGGRDKMQSLPVLAQALGNSDPKLQTVAARILEGAYRASFGEVQPGAVDPATANDLLAALPKLNKRQSNQVIAAVVHASVLSGQSDALFKALDALEDKALRSSAYSHLMVHGGSPELAKMTTLANGEDLPLAAAALQAARNYKGSDAAVQQQICELARGKVGSKDPIVSMRAAQILVKCDEASIDTLLDELDKRDAEKALTTGLVRSLYELCQIRQDKKLGSDAQCTRVRGMLEKWIQNTQLSPEIRAAALFEIGVQFADEKSEKLCQKFENDPELRVKTAAKESMRRIQRKLGKEVVNVGGPAGGHGTAPALGSVVRRPGAAPGSEAPKPAPKAPAAPKPTPPAPPGE